MVGFPDLTFVHPCNANQDFVRVRASTRELSRFVGGAMSQS